MSEASDQRLPPGCSECITSRLAEGASLSRQTISLTLRNQVLDEMNLARDSTSGFWLASGLLGSTVCNFWQSACLGTLLRRGSVALSLAKPAKAAAPRTKGATRSPNGPHPWGPSGRREDPRE